jgi:RimJ/RimL family protein N-acetyltransferase
MKLETKRLIIRPIEIEDKHEVFKCRSDQEANKYQGWIPANLTDVETFIEGLSKEVNVPGTWFQFVIQEKETQKIIGDLGIHFLDKEGKQAELGITLNKDFQNMGYATESVARVIEYLFNDLNKHRIITSIDPANENSVRLVQRIGFRKEAHFVESLFINGKWVDDLIYAMIEKDWENQHSST